MARNERYKVVVRDGGPNELYDEQADHDEKTNQFDNQQFVTVKTQLVGELAAWRRSTRRDRPPHGSVRHLASPPSLPTHSATPPATSGRKFVKINSQVTRNSRLAKSRRNRRRTRAAIRTCTYANWPANLSACRQILGVCRCAPVATVGSSKSTRK